MPLQKRWLVEEMPLQVLNCILQHTSSTVLSHVALALTDVEQLLDHLKGQLPKRNKNIPPELLAHYVASSFIALMTWWIDNEYPLTPEKMNEIYRQLVEPGTMAIMMG